MGKRGPKPVPVADRFWSRVNQHGPTPTHAPALGPCWLWTASLYPSGYGRFNFDQRCTYAHIVAYKLSGNTIPAGLELDHLCRNRACCNPAHLEPVTRQENMRRGHHATKTHCKHGHPLTPDNLQPNYRFPHHRICRTCNRINALRGYYRRRERSTHDASTAA